MRSDDQTAEGSGLCLQVDKPGTLGLFDKLAATVRSEAVPLAMSRYLGPTRAG